MAGNGKQSILSELDQEWNESSEHTKLKRELRELALHIIQDAARTQAEFEKLSCGTSWTKTGNAGSATMKSVVQRFQ